ncbi:MAG: xanthine dehydrogenase family protein, partial [Acholeplasmataceae bacterium]|nr:xanthine dehydrogenase family protein [Acholeplasmataceae bacterium]
MQEILKSIPKVDNKEKLSGSAKYTSDYDLENLYYAKTVRSTEARARIITIDIPKLDDGYFIVDHTHIPKHNVIKMIFDDWKVFADDQVHYIGEPILLVIGKDKQKIDDIITQISITYEKMNPVFDFKNSVIQKAFKKGDYEKTKTDAEWIYHETFETGYQEQAYIEPQGFIAYLEAQDKITLIGSIQCPYYVKNAVLHTLGYEEDKIRVIQPAVGGAFGGKEEFPSIMACQLAVAVHHLKVPIKMIYEREEDMLVTTKRHPSKIRLEATIKSNKITGIKAHVSLDGGAYIGLSGVVLSRSMIAVTSAYTIDNLDVSGDVYLTNTVPTGAFRGFGAPQMIFAIEMFVTHLANHLKADDYAFRIQHLAKQGDKTSTSGLFRDPIIMQKMIDKVTVASGYHEKRKAYPKAKKHQGIGMSWFLHGCGFTGSGESDHIHAKVKLMKDQHDHVHILVAAVDMGQGALTALKKIVFETLEIPSHHVIFNPPDTDFIVDSGPTVASRTTMIVGGLLARAALKLKNGWIQGEAQEIIEAYEQPSYMTWDEDTMQGDAYPAYSWGVNIVEVEVCPITYQVD